MPGTVCDDTKSSLAGWLEANAEVACRQLGYTKAYQAVTEETNPSTPDCFGEGNSITPVI